jgi:hypothetical protein
LCCAEGALLIAADGVLREIVHAPQQKTSGETDQDFDRRKINSLPQSLVETEELQLPGAA